MMTVGQFFLCLLIIIILKESLATSPAMEQQSDTSSSSASELGQAEDCVTTEGNVGATLGSPRRCTHPASPIGGCHLGHLGCFQQREGLIRVPPHGERSTR